MLEAHVKAVISFLERDYFEMISTVFVKYIYIVISL